MKHRYRLHKTLRRRIARIIRRDHVSTRCARRIKEIIEMQADGESRA